MVEYVSQDGRHRHPIDVPIWRCPSTGQPVNLTPGDGLDPGDVDTAERSVWRYAKALRVPAAARVSLGEGLTPLVSTAYGGGRPRIKCEYLAPSGSFKDRGMAVLVSYLKVHGVTEVMLDSSGNAAASLACYAAAAGMTARLMVPGYTSPAKVAQVRVYGAEVELVPGTRQDCAAAALRLAEAGLFYASHNWQPFFVEGTRTLAFEIWEQYGFAVPDNIVIPAGYGSNLMGCHLGFGELLTRGAIARVPRLFAAQPAHAAALHAAFQANSDTPVPIDAKPTVAEGIATTKPVRVKENMAALRDSGGGTVAVPEDAILPAMHALARQGFFVEPSSAVAGAGYEMLLADGTITSDQETVIVLTGNGLKSTDALMG
ncbi:pyridoxal-phosphate dependent enzyme [Thalassobaculum sp.]|uniref:pyridoxal-phosphate dependent enzyme n=1 Tax=Thalassobaculum sp. TaxID=2022740 RepID=UPI0032EFB80B